jgi:hypothetical protein
MFLFRFVERAVSLSGLRRVVCLVDLIPNQVPLNVGTVGHSIHRCCHRSASAARAEVNRPLEHLRLHGSIALVIGHGRKRTVGGQFMEVGTQTVSLGVDLGEGPALESLSSENSIPGTRFAGQKAACSTWTKKLSGFLSSTILPTGINGNLSSGQVLVGSPGDQRSGFALPRCPSSARIARTVQTRLFSWPPIGLGEIIRILSSDPGSFHQASDTDLFSAIVRRIY